MSPPPPPPPPRQITRGVSFLPQDDHVSLPQPRWHILPPREMTDFLNHFTQSNHVSPVISGKLEHGGGSMGGWGGVGGGPNEDVLAGPHNFEELGPDF